MSDASSNSRSQPAEWLLRAGEIGLFAVSLASLAYALVTSLDRGIDLALWQRMGREWVAGFYHPFYGPPPFVAVLFAPMALFSFDHLLIGWLLFNLGAAAILLRLTVRVFGNQWPLRMQLDMAALLFAWAPLRVALRNGQLSIIITALLAGTLLARKRGKPIPAGLLLGLSLCKYSLPFPFLLYFIWKKEWKLSAIAVMVPVVLTIILAARWGLSPIRVISDYSTGVRVVSMADQTPFTGATDLKPLFVGLLSGHEPVPALLSAALAALALVAMWFVFRRTPQCENFHFALLALFALWSVYHRSYDSVLAILPVALLIELIRERKSVRFNAAWLAGFGLFIIGFPGLLVDRLHLSGESLSVTPWGFLGLHIERLLVFAMFWSLLIWLWKSYSHQMPVARTALA